MNWLTNFIRPKIRSIVDQKDVPDNLWTKCPGCEGMLFHRELAENLHVCHHCGHHLRIGAADRLALLFDDGAYTEQPLPKVPHDPLKFKDRRKYADRLREARAKTGRQDALVIAAGTVGGRPAVIAALDFDFMGGSMGAAMGEGLLAAATEAVARKAAFIVIPSSGGARMQEGMISLMQMPRSIIAADMVKEAGLPYIVILTDPTTGGVSASFAMVGDIHIAEPGCMIGFAGKRVIQETIREDLPPGFQTAEYLLDHGMVDMVVPRTELHAVLARLLGLLMGPPVNTDGGGKRTAPNGKARNGHGKANGSGKSNGKGKGAKTARARAAVRPATTGPAQKPANDAAAPAPARKRKPAAGR